MGFTEDQLQIACEKNKGKDVIMDYLFTNGDKLLLEAEERRKLNPNFDNNSRFPTLNLVMDVEEVNQDKTQYEIVGCVVHLGNSIHVGHYVAYGRQDNEWIYFNDSKVAITETPSLGNGYIYILRKKED